MSFLNYFDKVYIVNLPHRTDRLSQTAKELAKFQISLDHEKIKVFPAISPESQGDFPSRGAKGCYMSHLKILEEASEQQFNRILIIEDDLSLNPNFSTSQKKIISQLAEKKWDMVYFGYHLTSGEESVPYTEYHFQNLRGDLRTTFFYGVDGRIIDTLIDYLKRILDRPRGHVEGGPMHVDGAYNHFRKSHPEMTTLIISPPLGWQRPSKSNIHESYWDHKFLHPFLSIFRWGKGQVQQLIRKIHQNNE